MARFPCAIGPHRNRGRNRTVYFHVYGAGPPTDSRIRLCDEHVRVAQHDLAEFEIDPDYGTTRRDGALAECLACRQPVGEIDWKLSVTCYEADNECKDYGASLHMGCSLPEWALAGEPTK